MIFNVFNLSLVAKPNFNRIEFSKYKLAKFHFNK